MKKLLVFTTSALLLVACSSTKNGAELYGNVNGGWQDDVDIMNLSATGLTKKLQKTGADVIYFSFNIHLFETPLVHFLYYTIIFFQYQISKLVDCESL